MTTVIVDSLNTGAAWVSQHMGAKRFYDYVQRFGFWPTDRRRSERAKRQVRSERPATQLSGRPLIWQRTPTGRGSARRRATDDHGRGGDRQRWPSHAPPISFSFGERTTGGKDDQSGRWSARWYPHRPRQRYGR